MLLYENGYDVYTFKCGCLMSENSPPLHFKKLEIIKTKFFLRNCPHPKDTQNHYCFDKECDIKTQFCQECKLNFHQECNQDLIFPEEELANKAIVNFSKNLHTFPIHALHKKIEIEINGKVIDRHYGEWLHIWSILTTRNIDDKCIDKLIGNVGILDGPANVTTLNFSSEGIEPY